MTCRIFSSPHRRLTAIAVVAAAATSVLSACVVEPARPRYAESEVVVGPRFRSEVVAVQPPLPREEVLGVAPGAGFVWAPGYWNWEGGRHVWVGGRWMAPREGYYWEPHSWVHTGEGWRLREGYWVRR